MADTVKKKSRAVKMLGITVLIVGVVFFLLRGPYLSNSIKRALIPVLENATGERIIIDKAVINLFPVYIQAKGFKMFDGEGNRLLWITKARAYIDVFGLFSKEIRVRKLTLLEPDLTASDRDIERMREKLNSGGPAGEYRLSLRNIKLTDGRLIYRNEKGRFSVAGKGLYLERTAKQDLSAVKIALTEGTVQLPNHAELAGSLEGKIRFEGNRIEVEALSVRETLSLFSTEGEIILSPEGGIEGGSFSVKSKIDASTINTIFALNNDRGGELFFTGSVNLLQRTGSNWPAFDLDLKTDSQFYLETLMEIINVNENIKGKLSLDGTIKGIFPDITGQGRAKLESAVFGGFPVDEATGTITYKDRQFALQRFAGRTYNGTMKGDAVISTENGNYRVDADMKDINSRQFFSFIKWDSPLPEGKISGNVRLSHERGHDLEVEADTHYRNMTKKEGNVLGRIDSATAALALKDDRLLFNKAVLSTGPSQLNFSGNIDLARSVLDLVLSVRSKDARDLTAPYFTKLSSPLTFDGTMKGPFKDPHITGTAAAGPGNMHALSFNSASADIAYRIQQLSVDSLVLNQDKGSVDISGTIDFRGAEALFSFPAPYYRARALFKDIDVQSSVSAFYGDMPLSGSVSGSASFEGGPEAYHIAGDIHADESTIYGHELDRLSIAYVLQPKGIELTSAKAGKGISEIEAAGSLSFDRTFDISLWSEKINVSDIPFLRSYPLNALFAMNAHARGSLDQPEIDFSLDAAESSFRSTQLGKGKIEGTFRGRDLLARGSFVDGLIIADAEARFSDGISWKVHTLLNKGRYDFLLSELSKDVPEDFLLSLEGDVIVNGQDSEFTVNSTLGSVLLSLYGYNLKNSGDIVIDLIQDELRISALSLSDKNAGITAEGSLRINKNFNLTLSGYLDDAPRAVLSDSITSLSGRSDFALSISGAWKNPDIVGDIRIDDGALKLSALPYAIGPVNGTVMLNKKRVVFESLEAKFAGGSLTLSGAGDLQGMSFQRFYVSGDIEGVNLKPSEGLSALLDGTLFYETSPIRSSLTGNVKVKRGRYTKRVDWKSWILGLKEVNASKAKYPSFIADTEINLHVSGDGNISIDNNIARTPIKIALNLTGTIGDIGLLGRIEANEGTVYFRGNEFAILAGSSVDFVDPEGVSPYYHILADTNIGDYYVKLTIDGTIDDFSLSLFSDPPLPETDILALLTLGQTTREAKGIESGIAAGEATAILTGIIQDAVEEELQYFTGFERFEIEPHTTTQGAFVPRVTVGKRLFEDRFLVTYSTAIGAAEESVIELEYRIDKNLSLVGSRNEIGSAGVDIKYRFDFR